MPSPDTDLHILIRKLTNYIQDAEKANKEGWMRDVEFSKEQIKICQKLVTNLEVISSTAFPSLEEKKSSHPHLRFPLGAETNQLRTALAEAFKESCDLLFKTLYNHHKSSGGIYDSTKRSFFTHISHDPIDFCSDKRCKNDIKAGKGTGMHKMFFEFKTFIDKSMRHKINPEKRDFEEGNIYITENML